MSLPPRSPKRGGKRCLMNDGCAPRSGSDTFVAQPEVFKELRGLTQITREKH